MNQPLLQHFDLLATAPGGVARLRELILTLAVRGKLVPQDPADEPSSVLLQKIRAEKDRLIAEGKIKRDKPLPLITDEEKPFELPQGWEWVRLNAMLQKIGAGSTPRGGKEVYVTSGVKFLRSQNVWDDGLRLAGVAFIRPETHAKMSGTVVVADDLLFNITGASIGRCAVVPSDFDEANVSQHVTIVRSVLPAINAFLHKVLVSQHVQQAVMAAQVGVSREGLSIAKLGNFLIPVPPLAEQSRIVARVEELMRLCDALETKGKLDAAQHTQLVQTLLGTLTDSAGPEELAANWLRVAEHFDLLLDRPENVDALEQTLLQLAVRGLLVPQDPSDEPASVLLQKIRAEKDRLIAAGKIKRDKPLAPITDEEKPFELPAGWECVRLADVIRVLNGRAYSKQELLEAGPTPVLRVGNLFTSKHWYYSDLALEPEKYCLEGDLLYAWSASFGPFIWRGPKAIYHYHIWKLEPWAAQHFDAGYFHKFLDEKTAEIKAAGHGVSMVHMTKEKMEKIVVPFPPLQEQSRIVARVEQLRQLCAELRQRLTASRATQGQLAQALVETAL